MFDIFQNTTRPKQELFFKKNDPNDVRLGEIISSSVENYEKSEIVVLGCPLDEGVARNKGRIGAAFAPDEIRAQFYKLSNFGVSAEIFDLGDTIIQKSLEETHDLLTEIVERVLRDGKRLTILGGGNDISYANGGAMAKVFGNENWSAFNIDAHLDVRADIPRNSGTPYRQLLEEKFILPANLYEIGYQSQANSPIYFDYLKNLGVTTISLEEFQGNVSLEKIICSLPTIDCSLFWGFDVDSVRAADAPGVSALSPIGLTAQEFIDLAGFAGSLKETKIIEFTEVNPNFDIDNRTAKLIAIAMHKFLQNIKQKG
ncbi:MAG TPA: formimidoylglutamase [Pyrinomonadaceae bacterium]|nr:formimidoylglutamase [Pyrinomonadaceae bacterium]